MTTDIKLSNFQIELQKTTLPNGLKFVHYKKLNAPIAITVASRSGARFDQKGKEGLAHFLEHMVFMGTKKYPNKKDLSLVLEDTGSSYSAATGTEAVYIEFTIAKKEHLSLVADTLDQLINKPLLLDKTIELEKKVIATEILTKLSTHKRILSNNIKKLMFGDNPISNNFSGNVDAINLINRADLLQQLNNAFPQDLTVVSCGDCDISELVSATSPVLSCSPRDNFNPAVTLPGSVFGITNSIKEKNEKLAYCKLAFATCGIGSKDRVALNILSQAVGRSRSSLLKEVLRYDNGLLYSVNSGNTYFADTGFLHIDFTLSKENLTKTLEKIFETFADLGKNGISLETLNGIKNKIINSSTISMQTVRDWVDFHFYSELLIRDNNYNYNDFLNEIKEMTKENIDAVARKYLTKENAYFWVVGDISEEELKPIFNK